MHPFALLALALAAPPQDTVPYPDLTDNRREVVNFNIEPVRAIAQASDGTVYALNSHGSQIVHHTDLGAEPEQIFQTVLNPVSIALWGDDHIVVAGGGTHVLALHDRATGDILKVLELPSEPADLVIHASSDAAFIACQGANAVVRVDLTLFQVTDTYQIPAERPRFLSLDPGDTPESSDDRVYVTPFVSGNGSGVIPESGHRSSIGNGYIFQGGLLPDQDLFSIGVGVGSSVTPIKQRVGTLLTAHGRHPGGKYWALNVDSQNQDPTRASEPLLRGNFVKNRVWIGKTYATLSEAPLSEQIDLDDENGDGAYAPNGSESVAFPFGIAFAPGANGKVYICSPLSDRVSIRNANGTHDRTIQLPDGSIPFDVEIDSVWNVFLFVHCFGTNKLLVYSIANPSLIATLDLGLDPTPAPIQRGRTIWYDAHRSMNARSSCNSCHPGGKSDFLGWQISDDPTDRKDVMVTQSLLGIEDTFPYHWRGERALIDFNGAFVDLLGGSAKLSEVPGGEFDDFQAFVFSLQPHANPREDLSREIALTEDEEVDDDGTAYIGDAQAGLTVFTTEPPLGGFNQMACVECHVPQSGSNNDFILEVGTDIPSAQVLEIAHLRELTHKDQPAFTLPTGHVIARSGFGVAHSGIEPGLFRFHRDGGFNLNKQQAAHVAAFVRRFDQGIAPAAHIARMLNDTTFAEINGQIRPQASAPKRWIDLVAFGRFTNPQTGFSQFGRFLYANTDYSLSLPMWLECNDSTASMSLPDLLAQVNTGAAQIVFLGIPPGGGRRFALDPDNDVLIDSDEGGLGTDPWRQDTDGDGEPDGYELANSGDPLDQTVMSNDQAHPIGQVVPDFHTASLAKFHITANEDVRIDSLVGIPGGINHTTRTPVFARSHTFVVQGLVPSTPAGAPKGAHTSSNIVNLYLIDRSGQFEPHQISIDAADMIHPVGATEEGSPLVLSSLSGIMTTAGSSAIVNVTAQIQQRFFDTDGVNQLAVEGQVAVFQVVAETSPNMYEIVGPSTPDLILTVAGLTTMDTQIELDDGTGAPTRFVDSTELPGPFIFAPASSSTGAVSFKFMLDGLVSGQHLRVRLIAILDPIAGTTRFVEQSLGRVTIPATAPEHRGLEFETP